MRSHACLHGSSAQRLITPLRRYRETFAVNLLGLGKLTEQVLQGGPGTELLPLCIKRPLGVIFAEQVPKGFGQATLCVVDELVPGRRAPALCAVPRWPADAQWPRSNAEAAGVRVGDTLRLVTAVVSVRDKTDTLSYYTCARTLRRAALRCASLRLTPRAFSRAETRPRRAAGGRCW